MNDYHPTLKVIAVLAFAFIFIFDFLAKDWPELFKGAHILAANGVILSQSYLVGFVIYLLSGYYPWLKSEQARKLEQDKMNELIAHRLKKLVTKCMHVMWAGVDARKSQKFIWLNQITESEFETLMRDTYHDQPVRHPRIIRDPGKPYGRTMTVGENILDCTDSIRTCIEDVLKFERYIDIELIELLYKFSELPLVWNWETYLEERPFLIDGKLFGYNKVAIGQYKSIFIEFDNYYRKIEVKLLELNDTSAGKEHARFLKMLRDKDVEDSS
ncbi:TPA: hypothetical protein JG810_004115 [Vibrio parahaemolyticus]|nr:hypothetical protein [Vibrio parahaemolyticus]